MKKRQIRGYDLRQIEGHFGLIGIDEAGRGALAGPVMAGAVLINEDFLRSAWCRRNMSEINDSKQLSAEQRESVYERMQWLRSEHRILFAGGSASVEEIEDLNILGATKLAMRRALISTLEMGQIEAHAPDPLFTTGEESSLCEGQSLGDWKVLIDGRPLKSFGFVHTGIVNGDAKSLVIAMASIVAKVERDLEMEIMEESHPGYGLGRHKGYATEIHREALLEKGPSPIHRSLFLRKLFRSDESPGQTGFAF
ncbi:MAG: ribonuclease HII [Opitutaceae bacterium]|nr:ribonuclease HII [Opitutaceae bacterium]